MPDPKKKIVGMQPGHEYASSRKYMPKSDSFEERVQFEDASNKGKLRDIDPMTGRVHGKRTLMVPPLQTKGLTMPKMTTKGRDIPLPKTK